MSANGRSTSPAHKKQKVAADAAPEPSESCQPQQSSAAPSIRILEIAAENGWFPWQDDREIRQNPDYSNLRLVSSEMKSMMDKPECGGPDFDVIVGFLDGKNGFNKDEGRGFCDHCFLNDGEGCDTCADTGDYEICKCKKAHRFGDSVRKLDPRLNQTIEFDELTARTQAKLLLRFLSRVAFNFHLRYYVEWEEDFEDLSMFEPDLTMIDAGMSYFKAEFPNELNLYNEPFYNFIHHLLFAGWAKKDSLRRPGSGSPYRHRFLQDEAFNHGWNGGHREFFHDIFDCFMRLHKCHDTRSVSNSGLGCEEPYTLSQIQYLPETIRRCVENCVDHEARALLGKPIADDIDIYRLVRQTYELREEDLSQVQWQPGFGVAEEDFVPLSDFSGYNPQHKRRNIDRTGLLWTTEKLVEEGVLPLDDFSGYNPQIK